MHIKENAYVENSSNSHLDPNKSIFSQTPVTNAVWYYAKMSLYGIRSAVKKTNREHWERENQYLQLCLCYQHLSVHWIYVNSFNFNNFVMFSLSHLHFHETLITLETDSTFFVFHSQSLAQCLFHSKYNRAFK